MAYMKVLNKTESKLRLLREPTFLSKAVLGGFLVGVLGIFLFGSESCLLKLVIGLGALFLSSILIDNYEICEIDKNLAVVKLIRLHWCQYLLENTGLTSNHPYVTIKLEDIQDVRVEEQKGAPLGTVYQVVFALDSGIKLGATEVYTPSSLSEHEETASVIRSFLNIPKSSESHDDIDYEGDGSSSSGDDVEMDGFEQISSDEIKVLEEELSKASQCKELVGDVEPDTNDAAAAASAACTVDDQGENAYQGPGENAASS